MTNNTTEGDEPDPFSFRVGDVWESPRGTIYKCTGEYISTKNGRPIQKRILRAGVNGDGKKITRDWDDVGSLDRGQFWVRHSWGGSA